MVIVVSSGNGDIIERMWRLMVSARRNDDAPEIWRLTEDIIHCIAEFYRLGETPPEPLPPVDRTPVEVPPVTQFLDIPVDPTTTMPHLLCYPNVVYHL
ncbi:MAG: hypothetical protein OHK0029_23050 [Armatimonadaceae bacterium]